MQSVKPLRLKRETYRAAPETDYRTVVNVWVDSGISHLDGVYSYRCPNELVDKIAIGSRLKVPFNSRSCEALVVEILDSDEKTEHLKVIESVLGLIPVANSTLINFYRAMAKHWASDPYPLIKFGIPSRVASVEKVLESETSEIIGKGGANRKPSQNFFMMHTPKRSAYLELVELAIERMKIGSTLLLLPDIKDVDRVLDAFNGMDRDFEIIRLDSSLSRAQRYENYLKTSLKKKMLVIGNRSALFAPVCNLNSIIVGFEKSEQYFEKKHPYWNTRESVFLRAQIENLNLYFTGYVPSSEIAQQIEDRNVKFINQRATVNTIAFPQVQGELLPDRLIPAIRKSLREGTVLFLVPRKGYANALLCAKCRNIALCKCGGRLLVSSQFADPICSVCNSSVENWQCNWCSGTRRYVAARGIDRFHEEIGRAFPNTTIQLSSAPNILEEVSAKTKIVIATMGSIPGNFNEYSAIVLLEGQRFLAASTSRFEELVYESFFEAAAHVGHKGNVFIVLDAFHPLVAAISKWNPGLLVKKILRENEEAFLPPFSSIAVLTVEKQEAILLRNGLAKSVKDGRLPINSQILLSQNAESDEVKILVSVPAENREVLAAFLLELSRKRAISKKSFVNIAIDPFTLLR
jgi:primosomal protein N' (replication factor Y)